MEVTGDVKLVSETETFPSGFSKRFIIIDVKDGNYVNQIGFEFFKDATSKLDNIAIGSTVTVKFNLGRAREYQGKWFANMHNGWQIDVTKAAEPARQSEPSQPDDPPLDDDIPF